jgi:4-hydroxy-3-methylbut-2-enyl diphosphate reductase
VGDEIDVYVVRTDDSEGSVVLSKRRADQAKAWKELEEMYENNEILEAVVTERVKGGLLVDVGVRGFVPASHVARNYVEDLESYVGKSLRMKIIELDRQRNNVVLSHKEVLEEEYEKQKETIFDTYQPGDIVDGVVRRLTDFGAFVDIGSGVEGLLHVSEMAYSRVNHPSDILSENQEIKVMILNLDKETERISLGLKQTLPDPWDNISSKYHEGDIVQGEVTRTVDFGAFVKLEDGVEGLVHISQLADHHVANTEEVVSSGQQVNVKIISIDEEARRIGLSIKEAQKERKPKPEPAQEVQPQDEPESSGITIGDIVGDLGSLFNSDDE